MMKNKEMHVNRRKHRILVGPGNARNIFYKLILTYLPNYIAKRNLNRDPECLNVVMLVLIYT